MLVPNIRSRAPSSPREQLFETGAAELEVVLAAVEGQQAAAEQEAVAGEGVGGAQGQLVDGVGGERQVLDAPEMAWLWALEAICGMIRGVFDGRGVGVGGFGAGEGWLGCVRGSGHVPRMRSTLRRPADCHFTWTSPGQ